VAGDAAGRVLSGGGAVTVQLVIAGGSRILQAIAARTLGAAGYGTYAVRYSILVLLLAVQTSWVATV
jgi:hypothetical protein